MNSDRRSLILAEGLNVVLVGWLLRPEQSGAAWWVWCLLLTVVACTFAMTIHDTCRRRFRITIEKL